MQPVIPGRCKQKRKSNSSYNSSHKPASTNSSYLSLSCLFSWMEGGKIKNVNPTGFLSIAKDGDLMFTLSLINRET